MFNHRTETYAIPVMIKYDGEDSIKLQALKQNIQYVFDVENKVANRPYFYSILYDWNGLVRLGSLEVIVNAVKEWVKI